MSETHKVQDPPEWWTDDEKLHRLPRVLRCGPAAIRKEARAGRVIFPNPGEQEPVESSASVPASSGTPSIGAAERGVAISAAFDVRLERSDFAPHAWPESIEGIARTPFKAAPQLEGWDDEIQGQEDPETKKRSGGWVDSIDMKDPLHSWAAERFEDSMFEGVVFALVDQDPRSPFGSAEARKLAGGRPRVRTFRRKHLWTFSRDSEQGEEELARVVINRPQVTARQEDPNAWAEDSLPGYQVILAPDIGAEPGSEESKVRSRVYVQRSESSDFEEDPAERRIIDTVNGGGELKEIPLVPLYGHRTGFMRGVSPFRRTADSQVALANASSELQDFNRELALVIAFGAGWKQEDATKQPLGGSGVVVNGRFITVEAPDATMALHQPDPAASGELKAWIEAKAEAIRKAHRQIHSATPRAPVTAREVTLEAVYAGSQLELWVRLHEAAWKKILEYFALLAGLPKLGTVSISHDFGLPTAGMDAIWNGYLQSAGVEVPAKLAFSEAKRHGWVDEGQPLDDILKMVDEERRREPTGI